MKFGTVTRGEQKIYVLLKAKCPENGTIAAESRCKSGASVPALVSAKDPARGEYVLILPLLRVDQTVTVRVLDANGKVVEETTRRVGHLTTALNAKYNTFSKAPGVNDIRNFDRLPRHDVSSVELNQLVHTATEPDDSELVNITISTGCREESTPRAPFTITAFDNRGNDVPITNCTVLGDAFERPVPHSGYRLRTIRASFRRPYAVDCLFIWIRFEDDAFPPALFCVSKWHTEEFRKRFDKEIHQTGRDYGYEEWFYHTQRKSALELAAQREARFEIEPKFSIIVPLYKTPIDFFDPMVESVLDQTYGKFELILVNSTPEDRKLSAAVAARAKSDDRVRVITLDKNYGIAGNTNEGIRIATGDFLCFFDHDDVLEPNILFEYVDAINRYPETDLLYCDEDKLKDGRLIDGFVKSDFSWELLTTCNFVCHLLTVRKSVVDTVELSGDEVSGAQDWDMTMKVAEKARNIFHVRKVLYHWRAHEKSVAGATEAKDFTHRAGEIAIQNHFDRIGVPVRIHDGHIDNMHRIEYILPEDPVKVSIIIPNKDHAAMLGRCIDSIVEKTTYSNYEIVIVENNSVERATFEYYDQLQRKHDFVKVITWDGSFNFSLICNYGAEHASGSHLLFLNNDMEVITPDWIERLLGPLQREEVAVTGARLLYPDGTIQHNGIIIPKTGPMHIAWQIPEFYCIYFGMTRNAHDVQAVTGACLMVSREDFESVGGFDEALVVAYNDVDFCLRLREKGKSVIIEPSARLYHYESVSRGYDQAGESKTRLSHELAIFQERYAHFWGEGDPLYSVNVRYNNPYYALDWTVRA